MIQATGTSKTCRAQCLPRLRSSWEVSVVIFWPSRLNPTISSTASIFFLQRKRLVGIWKSAELYNSIRFNTGYDLRDEGNRLEAIRDPWHAPAFLPGPVGGIESKGHHFKDRNLVMEMWQSSFKSTSKYYRPHDVSERRNGLPGASMREVSGWGHDGLQWLKQCKVLLDACRHL